LIHTNKVYNLIRGIRNVIVRCKETNNAVVAGGR
jgi:hypothetical protein